MGSLRRRQDLPLMPVGTFHIETGLLLQQRGGLILQRDDGGRWRLDADRDIEKFLGQRVRVKAIRSGFDLLDVSRVTQAA
jgi:hypothetical protein